MNISLSSTFYRLGAQRVLLFGLIILAALIAFEFFNFSTTVFALSDLLGDLSFVGIRWAVILAIAFCGIDFAGIARLFTPGTRSDNTQETWYLFGAWFLGAFMNACLTWWGVSLAIMNHETLGNQMMSRDTLLLVVPIFVAVMVLLIRILIIGSFSMSGDRLFSADPIRSRTTTHSDFTRSATPSPRPLSTSAPKNGSSVPNGRTAARPTPLRTTSQIMAQMHNRNTVNVDDEGEPIYQPTPLSARSNNQSQNSNTRRF